MGFLHVNIATQISQYFRGAGFPIGQSFPLQYVAMRMPSFMPRCFDLWCFVAISFGTLEVLLHTITEMSLHGSHPRSLREVSLPQICQIPCLCQQWPWLARIKSWMSPTQSKHWHHSCTCTPWYALTCLEQLQHFCCTHKSRSSCIWIDISLAALMPGMHDCCSALMLSTEGASSGSC